MELLHLHIGNQPTVYATSRKVVQNTAIIKKLLLHLARTPEPTKGGSLNDPPGKGSICSYCNNAIILRVTALLHLPHSAIRQLHH